MIKTVRFDTGPCRWGEHEPFATGYHTVYIARDAEGRPLYIGRTKSPSQRARAHKTRARNTWWPLMAHVDLILTCCLDSASPLELFLIREMKPRFNDSGQSYRRGWATRRGTTVEAEDRYIAALVEGQRRVLTTATTPAVTSLTTRRSRNSRRTA